MNELFEQKLARPVGNVIFSVYGAVAFDLTLNDGVCRISIFDRSSRMLPTSEEERQNLIQDTIEIQFDNKEEMPSFIRESAIIDQIVSKLEMTLY